SGATTSGCCASCGSPAAVNPAPFPEGPPGAAAGGASAHFGPGAECGGGRELGSDLYDFYDMGEGLLGVATGDVAGKGVPAALYAAYASGAVRARAFERRTPSDLMERVNRTLRRKGIEGLFCTLACALFDFQDRSLRLANSGLPHPLHYRAALGRAVPLEVSGLPLGTFDGVTYDELRAALEPGDAFVFYSDGVIEARSGKEEYGAERLSRGLEAAASGSAKKKKKREGARGG